MHPDEEPPTPEPYFRRNPDDERRLAEADAALRKEGGYLPTYHGINQSIPARQLGCLLLPVVLLGIGYVYFMVQDRPAPPAPPDAAPAAAVAVEDPGEPGVGYLWWKDDLDHSVFVISSQHQRSPSDEEQAKEWALRGELKLIEPGTRVRREEGKHPWFTEFLEVAEGPARGFRGWVPIEAWQFHRPGAKQKPKAKRK